jgi:hypothetical protein
MHLTRWHLRICKLFERNTVISKLDIYVPPKSYQDLKYGVLTRHSIPLQVTGTKTQPNTSQNGLHIHDCLSSYLYDGLCRRAIYLWLQQSS